MSIQEVTVYVGVDVASKHLDLYFPDSGKSQRINNDAQAIRAFCDRLAGDKRYMFVMGGRGGVRSVLYMATLVAIRFNTKIKALYIHLKSKGKESKVAIVACMRKFITTLNYCLKTNQLWNAN